MKTWKITLRPMKYHPESPKDGERLTKPRRELLARFLAPLGMTLLALALCLTTAANSAFAIAGVDQPPPPSQKHEARFATPEESRLDNGLRVIVVRRPGLPLLAAAVLLRHGAEVDPPNLPGAASMTADLLTKGTESKSAPEIAQAIESLGGSLDSSASWDSSLASVVVMSDKAEPALTILADIVRHPAFKQEEIDRLKNQRLDGLRVAMQQPHALARFVTARVVFGAGAYGHPAGGTLESVQQLSRNDITALYQRYYAPQNAAFILVGDVTLAQGKGFAEKFFGDWKNGAIAPNEQSKSGAPNWKPKNVVIDMPQAGQAAVTMAKPAIKRDSVDYYTALVANAALGNGFASRLNREIRIKRGLSYGAGSAIDPRREVGPFVAFAQTKNESAAEVAQLMKTELQSLVNDPVQGEELKSRQAVLTGGYARNLETNLGFAGEIAKLAAYDLPLDTLDRYIPSIDAVTTDAVTAFAKKDLATKTSLIIVGKASAFLDSLKKDVPDVRLIEQKDLDLNQPKLTK